MNERDELAELAYRSMYSEPDSSGIQPLSDRPQWEIDMHYGCADAILSRGYRRV